MFPASLHKSSSLLRSLSVLHIQPALLLQSAGEVLLDYIKGPFKEMAFFADKDTEFALAELANDAGICGAAKLVLK